MKVKAQLFAQLRDAAGTSELIVDLKDQATISDLLEKLYTEKPPLRRYDQSILVAVGVDFVRRDYAIQPDDEIAVMPPVQGG